MIINGKERSRSKYKRWRNETFKRGVNAQGDRLLKWHHPCPRPVMTWPAPFGTRYRRGHLHVPGQPAPRYCFKVLS